MSSPNVANRSYVTTSPLVSLGLLVLAIRTISNFQASDSFVIADYGRVFTVVSNNEKKTR